MSKNLLGDICTSEISLIQYGIAVKNYLSVFWHYYKQTQPAEVYEKTTLGPGRSKHFLDKYISPFCKCWSLVHAHARVLFGLFMQLAKQYSTTLVT